MDGTIGTKQGSGAVETEFGIQMWILQNFSFCRIHHFNKFSTQSQMELPWFRPYFPIFSHVSCFIGRQTHMVVGSYFFLIKAHINHQYERKKEQIWLLANFIYLTSFHDIATSIHLQFLFCQLFFLYSQKSWTGLPR